MADERTGTGPSPRGRVAGGECRLAPVRNGSLLEGFVYDDDGCAYGHSAEGRKLTLMRAASGVCFRGRGRPPGCPTGGRSWPGAGSRSCTASPPGRRWILWATRFGPPGTADGRTGPVPSGHGHGHGTSEPRCWFWIRLLPCTGRFESTGAPGAPGVRTGSLPTPTPRVAVPARGASGRLKTPGFRPSDAERFRLGRCSGGRGGRRTSPGPVPRPARVCRARRTGGLRQARRPAVTRTATGPVPAG